MPIFIAVPLVAESSAFDAAVRQSISSPADRYKLQSDRGWLIKFAGTSVELSDHLGLTGPKAPSHLGSAIIVPVAGYYGLGPTDMWEWLKTRLEQ